MLPKMINFCFVVLATEGFISEVGLNFGKLERWYPTCNRLDWAVMSCFSVNVCVIVTFYISFSFKVEQLKMGEKDQYIHGLY